MLTVSEAKEKILHFAHSFGTQTISIHQAMHRVLAEDVYAERDSPPFNRSAMDGYALQYNDYESGTREFTIIETIYAGQVSIATLKQNQCYKIMTGAAVPDSANCVIRVEDSTEAYGKVVFTDLPVKSFQNIAKQGEDFRASQKILASGQVCTPMLISMLASLGKEKVVVQKLPTVGLISTGDEIIPIHQTPSVVQIRDSNSFAIVSFLEYYKIMLSYRKLVPDDKEQLKESIKESLNYQITIISGGVSAGDADFVPEVLSDLGVKKEFHKVQIKPGKPLWFGVYEGNKVVFSLPGNPMSVQVAYKVFIEPYLRKCFGLQPTPVFQLPMLSERKKKIKFDEFFPCNVTNSPHSGLMPAKFNGSGDISGSFGSDGIALQPAHKDILNQKENCEFIFWHTF